MPDPVYKPYALMMKSKGVLAKYAPDRFPESSYYLNLDGALEREEDALSSRYGTLIINRDPLGVGTNNYFFSLKPVTLGRLLSSGPSPTPYRYVVLSDGSLWYRATDVQGAYTKILNAGLMSGNPCTALVDTCPQSSLPFIFFYDRSVSGIQKNMFKDNGSGNPSLIGIQPPTIPATTQNFAPNLHYIEIFNNAAGYTTTGNLSIIAAETAYTIEGNSPATTQLSGPNRYQRYSTAIGAGLNQYYEPADGMIAKGLTSGGTSKLKFQTNLITSQFDIFSPDTAYSTPDLFAFQDVHTTVSSNATGTIGKTLPVTDFSAYDPADLFVIALKVSAPQNVQEIRIQFDVAGSNFSSSYYTKSLIPISYQGYLSNPQTSSAVVAINNQIYQQSVIANNPNSPGLGNTVRKNPLRSPTMASDVGIILDSGGGGGDIGSSGIAPSQLPSGAGAWAVIYLQKGDFLPVGSAGQPGLDWSNITGWQIQVTTNSGGSSDVSFNALYLQGGGVVYSPVVPASGPSSYGGVGYDVRYRYYNANTGTPSNPSREQYFSITPFNPGGVSTLFPLRQAINVLMGYSPDAQVTHVQIYIRGGLFGDNWYFADQVPNASLGGTFNYTYTLPDSVLASGDILELDRDVPVTSTLQNPIVTTTTNSVSPFPAGTNTPTSVLVQVANAGAKFVSGQIVFIGQPDNLEEVVVTFGGTGQFDCYIQLPHTFGEQVQSFSTPFVGVHLAAIAYGQHWMAGDPNNPHFLYYTPRGYPENCPPQNHIPVGTPSDPITSVFETRGVLFVRTMSTHYQIFPGNPPYAQSTGSKHGGPASFGSAIAENEIFYQSNDGFRSFKGTDGPYISVLLEWLFRNVSGISPLTLVDTTKLAQTIAAFKDTFVHFIYIGIDNEPHRIVYDTIYKRFHNDDLDITAILVEIDTNTLVYALEITPGHYAIVQETYSQDYDDGGWVTSGSPPATALAKNPIPVTIQTEYLDQGFPNNPKQYNVLTIDANPNGQTITPLLLFDDNNGTVAPVTPTPSTFTGTVRQKFQFQINAGNGQQAYRISLQTSWAGIAAPEIYQAHIFAAVLAEVRASYDSYWVDLGNAQSGIIKQGYFDWTTSDGNSVTVNLFADGNTIPFYTFILPANPSRQNTPIRVRFGNILGVGSRLIRLFRIVATSPTAFQWWSPVVVEYKPVGVPKGYQKKSILGITP